MMILLRYLLILSFLLPACNHRCHAVLTFSPSLEPAERWVLLVDPASLSESGVDADAVPSFMDRVVLRVRTVYHPYRISFRWASDINRVRPEEAVLAWHKTSAVPGLIGKVREIDARNQKKAERLIEPDVGVFIGPALMNAWAIRAFEGIPLSEDDRIEMLAMVSAHEIGHALGLYHEQSDVPGNIMDGWQSPLKYPMVFSPVAQAYLEATLGRE